MGALDELRREGKIRHIGLSNVSVSQIERARTIVPIVTVQNRYNLAERAHDPVVTFCEGAGIVFIPWFPLAKGALASSRTGSLARIAKRHACTPAQVALAWLLQRSDVMLPIPGTTSERHLDENLAAVAIELDEEDVRKLEMHKLLRVKARAHARKLARKIVRPPPGTC